MKIFASVLSVFLIVKMSVATHELTHGHHFIPCEDGVEQLVCPGDRQCIHKQKVRQDRPFNFVFTAHACSKF